MDQRFIKNLVHSVLILASPFFNNNAVFSKDYPNIIDECIMFVFRFKT